MMTARVSESLKFFEQGFRDRWNVDDYDPDGPALFVGMYRREDVDALMAHKGLKVVVWGGADVRDDRLASVRHSRAFSVGHGWMIERFIKNRMNYKELNIPFKSYSQFTPIPLGDCVYAYAGLPGSTNPKRYGRDSINIIAKEFEVIFPSELLPIERLRDEFYARCFAYIMPNPRSGNTTMYEMGHMGRETVTIGDGMPVAIRAGNAADAVAKLKAAKFADPNSVARQMGSELHNFDDWLNAEFWYR